MNLPPMWSDRYFDDCFHVFHKVPAGDSPYVRAKHVQLVERDPERAIALFWAAINAGDRVDSALKDMAIVMKQQNRPEEAIQAIKSFREACSDQAQEPLDNVLLDLYKRCGKLDEQIALLQHKLHLIHQGLAFNGKRTKTARSQGRKFQVSIEQEASRLLGNLGWAYMEKENYIAAEAVYRKALSILPDVNKVCNLGICLMKQGKLRDAKEILESVKLLNGRSMSHWKSYERAQEMLLELQAVQKQGFNKSKSSSTSGSGNMEWNPFCSSSLEDQVFQHFRGLLAATSGFAPVTGEASNSPSQEPNYRHTIEQQLWTGTSSDCSMKRLPLTADWTNKQQEFKMAKSRTTAPGWSRDEENVPTATRRCLFSNTLKEMVVEEEENASWDFALDLEELLGFCAGESEA